MADVSLDTLAETVRDALHSLARYTECGDHDEDFRKDCESCVALAAFSALVARAERAENALKRAVEYADGLGLTDATHWVRDARAVWAGDTATLTEPESEADASDVRSVATSPGSASAASQENR